jgi:hypothetical protein
MIVLLDEPVPHKLRTAILGHKVSTTVYRGWGGLKNGRLLKAAEEAGIEVFVTCDQSIPKQQNLASRNFGVVILSRQDWPLIALHLAEIQYAVDHSVPGSVLRVECE